MRRILGLIIVTIFVLSTAGASVCEAIDIYTFKKDRVDQSLSSGNRGFISGTPSAEPTNRNTKRTLIGVDVELPMTESILQVEGADVSIQPAKKSAAATKSSKKKVTLVEEYVVEEEYIK